MSPDMLNLVNTDWRGCGRGGRVLGPKHKDREAGRNWHTRCDNVEWISARIVPVMIFLQDDLGIPETCRGAMRKKNRRVPTDSHHHKLAGRGRPNPPS